MAEADARLQVVLEAKIDKLIDKLNSATRAVYGAGGKMQKSVDQVNRKFEQLGSGLGRASDRIRGYLAAIGVGLSIREVQQYADAWTEARNKLAAAGVETAKLASRQNQLADLANKTRSGFTETVDLYAKLTRATEVLGASEAQVAQATETVNKAFKAGGAAASEQHNAILQLGQALGSGVLQGDELRSIRENAPLLAKAIAKEFDTTAAGLKKLGAEGQLTSDRVFKGILNAGKEIDAQFATTIPTIADSFVKLQTEFGRYINSANAASGASAQLSGFISQVADNFEQLADAAIITAAVIGGALAGQAMVRAVTAMAALAGGATGAAGAMTILRGAMAFLGGPWGVAITAIGAAVGYLALESGKAAVQAKALEDRIGAQATALGAAEGAAAAHRTATGNLNAAEQQAAINTAKLTGEVKLLENAHYRAAAAAKAHALEEVNARVQAAKTDLAAVETRIQKRSDRAIGSVGESMAFLPDSERQFIRQRAQQEAAAPDAKLLATARNNVALLQAELAKERNRSLKDPGFQPPNLESPVSTAKTGGSKTAATPRDRSDERLAQIDAAMAEAEQQLLQAMSRLTLNIDERAELEKRLVDQEARERSARLDKVAADIADDKGLKAAAKDELIAQVRVAQAKGAAATRLEKDLIDRDAALAKTQQEVEVRRSALGAEEEILGLQLDLAKTADERRDLELRRLAIAEDGEREDIRLLRATGLAADAAEAAARERVLNEGAPLKREGIRRDTAGPLERYADSIDDINTAMQNFAVNGIQSVSDALADAITGATSFKQAFRQVISSMLAEITRINIQQAFGKSSAGFLSSLFSGGSGALLGDAATAGLYADGGLVQGPGSGRSDSIPAYLSNGEFVVNARAASLHRGLLQQLNGGVRPRSYASGGSVSYGDVNVNMTVTAHDAASFRRSQAQISSDLRRQIGMSARRGIG